MKRSLIVLLVLLCVGFLGAQEAPGEGAPGGEPAAGPAAVDETALVINAEGTAAASESAPGVSAGDVFRMILVLIGVVAAIYGIFHLMKKAGGPGFSSDSPIRVLSTQGLGTNRALHLVEVGNQVFLVGASEHQVSLVSEIADKETIDRLRLEADRKPGTPRQFSGILKNLMTGRRGAPNSGIADSMNYMKKQKDRLKDL